MKVRKGFVSNSSSSSFVCDITGADESGWDICLNDARMVECSNGHTFAYDGFADVEAWVESELDYDDGDYYDNEGKVVENAGKKEPTGGYKYNIENNYGLPPRLCPICQKDEKVMKAIKERLTNEAKRLGVDL